MSPQEVYSVKKVTYKALQGFLLYFESLSRKWLSSELGRGFSFISLILNTDESANLAVVFNSQKAPKARRVLIQLLFTHWVWQNIFPVF